MNLLFPPLESVPTFEFQKVERETSESFFFSWKGVDQSFFTQEVFSQTNDKIIALLFLSHSSKRAFSFRMPMLLYVQSHRALSWILGFYSNKKGGQIAGKQERGGKVSSCYSKKIGEAQSQGLGNAAFESVHIFQFFNVLTP